MIITLERSTDKHFGRGERVIMVDGVRWGRTIVTQHGCHGTKHVFAQEHGGIIEERPGTKYPGEVCVRSEKKKASWHNDTTWRPTEDRVLDKVKELIESGKLIHPVMKQRKNDAQRAAWAAECEALKAKEAEEFRAKAAKCLPDNLALINRDEMIDRIIEAMQWAQGQ